MSQPQVRPVQAESAGPDWLKAEDAIPELLATVPLFQGLDPATLAGLTTGCTLVEIPAGTRLIEEGDAGDTYFVVIKGRLQAVQRADGQEILLSEMTRGASVGEAALLESTRRNASVVAVEPSGLIALTRSTFEHVLEKTPAVRQRLTELVVQRRDWAHRRRQRPEPAALLRRLAELTHIDDATTLRALEEEVSWIAIPAKTFLFHYGDAGDALYFVLEGQLDIVAPRSDGSRVRINQVGPGATLGEMALLTNAPRSADVVAASDACLLRLSRTGYDTLVRSHPETTVALSRALASRLAGQIQARTVRTQIGSMPIPTDAEVKDIVATPDLVLRNLRITQMYFQLSLQMAGLLGQQDANWCTFATHASKTAGYSIRKEELPGYGLLIWLEDNVDRLAGIEELVNGFADRIVRNNSVAALMEAATRHISNCISAGNLKVFAELAPVFAAFLRNFQTATSPEPDALQDVLALLDPGDVNIGGQKLLAEALALYHDAMFETDMKRKAELILLANCQIGLHEQTRLQPYIVEALDTPIGDVLDGVRDMLTSVAPGEAGRVVLWAREWAGPLAALWFRRLATRMIMALRLPYGDLGLGRDLPRLPNRQVFPDVLVEIELEPLRALVKRFDRTRGALRNSRAVDWGNLDDRMNTIVNLFRSRQKSYELFGQPFLYEQRNQLSEGFVPRGRL
jgi:CRP-like cAMP-binding protein